MARLQISLLGPLQARYDGQRLDPLTTRRAADLLTYLLLAPRIAHSRRSLAALFWPDLPAERAAAALRQTLFRLQRWLEQIPGLDGCIGAQRQAITITSDAISVDVLELEQAWAAVERHAHRSAESCRVCLGRLTAALDLCIVLHGHFRPDHQDDDAYAEWLHQRLTSVLPLLSRAHLWIAGYALRQGRLKDVERIVHRWIEIEPWQETARRMLMLALALDDRRVEALAHFRAYQGRLQHEFSFDPDPETRQLAEQIARLPADRLRPQLFSIPLPDHALIGREAELKQLSQLLSDPQTRLVTLIGIGGIGKTMLAQRAAHDAADDFRDGAALVSLVGRYDATAVVQAVADTLSLRLGDRRHPVDQLAETLRPLQLLVVLDNAEQVDGIDQLITALLRDCPQLVLLVTSRASINHRRERALFLDGLACQANDGAARATSPAAQLFNGLVRELAPNRSFTDDPAAVEAVCTLLDGHPLAITLYAHQSRFRGVSAVDAQLLHGLLQRAGSLSGLPERQQRISVVIAESVAAAGPQVAELLAAVSWFETGFSDAIACAVAALDPAAWVEQIGRALAFGLVRREGRRYSMHPLVRAYYTAGAAGNPSQCEAARARYVDVLLSLPAASKLRFINRYAVEWSEQHAIELDEMFAVLRQVPAVAAWQQLHAALIPLISITVILGWQRSLLQILAELLPQTPGDAIGLAVQLRLHAVRAWLAASLRETETATAAVAAALALPVTASAAGDRLWVRRIRAMLLIAQQRLDEAAADLEAAPLNEDIYSSEVADPVALRGRVARFRGDLTAAADLFQQARIQRRAVNDTRGEIAAVIDLAQTYLILQQHDPVEELLTAAVELARSINDPTALAASLENLGSLRVNRNSDLERAERELLEADTIAQRIGHNEVRRFTLNGLARLFRLRRRPDTVLRYTREYLLIELQSQLRAGGLTMLLWLIEALLELQRRPTAAVLLPCLIGHSLADDALRSAAAQLPLPLSPPAADDSDDAVLEMRLRVLLNEL
jgi:DNA-binding SARP family transcriptional activator/tetratricopeptide (TPR) repeat protein